MKKWLCLLLAGVLTFSLAACGRGQNTDPSDAVTESASSTENTESTSPNQSVADNEAVFTKVYGAYTYTITGTQATDKILTITDKTSGNAIQTLLFSENEWFTKEPLYLVDVTFDGNLDILIPYQRPASAAYFQAYVWQGSEGKFVYAPQFENLPNFIIDTENKHILSTHTASQITSYSINYYDVEVKDFRPSHAIYWEPDASENKIHFVEQQYKNGTAVTVKDCLVEKTGNMDLNKADPQIAEYFASDSFWDLDSQKWKDQFYKPAQSGATEDVQITVSDSFIASCNMNAGGYVNFLNGKYYYLDTENRNRLFMSDADGKNAICIDSCTDETLSHIAAGETAVYYLKRTKLDTPLEFNNTSVSYSIVFEGQLHRFCDGNVTVLSEENVVDYALSKEYVFYTTADLKVYRMKHDGTEKTAILDLQIPMNVTVSGDKLYAYADETIISTDFDGKNSFTSRLYMYAGAFNESALYFVDLNGYSLWKTELSDKDTYAAIDNMQRVTDEKIRSYTVYNGRLVYEKMHTDEIVIADMDGKNPKVVCSGKSPIALNGHLFYLDNGVICVADI